ncbi:acetamidase/formamidase family protein [Sporosarcina sp. FA9]|uniref:acetamidase/formamidase family protein n=1 Tax=Sporosarcina sp. FA9 TaxID=3413030 RepID=UPI003F6554BD
MIYLEKNRFVTSFSSAHEPAYTVALGETFVVETHDCYSGVFKSEEQLRTDVEVPFINPATGPIYIEGLQAGDTLRVEILDIQLDEFGVMMLYPGMGPIGELVPKMDTRIMPIAGDKVIFNENIHLPLRPMIGVMGVAPEGEAVSTVSPGDHGGNMDTKYITTGNTVYFPVFHDGGLFGLGDMHAAMGDGELNGSGVEIGGKVTLRLTKVTGKITMPFVETMDSYMVISSGKTFEEATNRGLETVVALLQEKLSLPFNEAYRLLSATCDLQISQIVNPLMTVRVAVPKSLLGESIFKSN